MKHLICLLAFLTLLQPLPIFASEASGVPYLVALGDSITTGYELPGGRYGCANYVNLTAESLSLPQNGYANYAVNGYRAGDLLTLLPEYRDDIARAGILVFDIGYNDILSVLYSAMCRAMKGDYYLAEIAGAFRALPKEEQEETLRRLPSVEHEPYLLALYAQFEADLTAILDTLHEYAPEARIYMQSIYNPLAALGVFTDFSNGAVEKLNGILADAAKKYGCGFLDVYTAFSANESAYTYMSRWDIHPNEEGHRVISALFTEALEADGFAPRTAASEEAGNEASETSGVISESVQEPGAAPAAQRRALSPFLLLLCIPLLFAVIPILYIKRSRRRR